MLAAARKALRDKRFRSHSHDGESVSAEKGYLKETGNLVFHLALILVIIGVAVGHLFGWKGDVIVPVGKTFGNALINYDTFSPGPWVDPERDLSPFRIRVDEFDATFEERLTSKRQFGQPRDFTAHVSVQDRVGEPTREADIKVNHPLEMDGAGVFLLGNGYAPGRHRPRRGGHRDLQRPGAVPRPGQQLHVGRRRSRSPVPRRSSWASTASSSRRAPSTTRVRARSSRTPRTRPSC